MDAVHLATLREVADRGSVTEAARVLHCTPSAVSQQLKALERAAGTPLTERAGRGIRLTQAGHALAESAVEVAVALERARAACARFAARTTGTVRITAFQSAARMMFPALLSRIAADPTLSGISVECGEADVAQSEFPALTAEFDIVLAHRPDRGRDWPALVTTHALLREPLDIALPSSHRLAGRPSVTPGDLRGETWLAVRPGFPLADVVEAIAARDGVPARIAHRINDFAVLEAMVAAGHGISLLPRYSVSAPSARGYALVPLSGLRAGRRIEALARPDRVERVVVRQVLTELRRISRAIVEAG